MKLSPHIHSVARQSLFWKDLSFPTLAGCTAAELRRHMELQFKPGMCWENYGEWEIDHITPVTFFDLSVPVEYLACAHFSNLQPLWKSENIRKSNRVGGVKIVPVKRKQEQELINYEEIALGVKAGDQLVFTSLEKAREIEYSILNRGVLTDFRVGKDGYFRVRVVSRRNRRIRKYVPVQRKRNDIYTAGGWIK